MTNDVINILRPSSVDGSTWFAAQLATLGSGSLTGCPRILPLIITRSRLVLLTYLLIHAVATVLYSV